jgi:hypothetical protein
MIATGGGDGCIRLYAVNGKSLSLSATRQLHTGPVTSISFTQNGFVSAASDGIRFCKIDGSIYSKYDSDEPMLSLACISSGKMIVVAGYNSSISLFKVADGSLFRRHKLSQSAYPLTIAIDKFGLFIAVAMSDAMTRILDLFSGDVLYSFHSHAGVITSIQFHEGDLLIASFSGAIMRWALPQTIHNAMAQRRGENEPVLKVIMAASPPVDVDRSSAARGSMMKGAKPEADWIFKEVRNEQLPSGNPQSGDITAEEEDEVDQGGFDGPRPVIAGADEARVDDIVRTSFIRVKKDAPAPAPEEPPPPKKPAGKPKRPIPQPPPQKPDSDGQEPPSSAGSDRSLAVSETKSDEMKAAAAQLTAAFDNAKTLLTARPSCPEEVAAQQVLKDTMDSVKRRMFGNLDDFKTQIKDLAEKIWTTVQKLD